MRRLDVEQILTQSFTEKVGKLHRRLPQGPLDEIDDLDNIRGFMSKSVDSANLPDLLGRAFPGVDSSKGMCLQVYAGSRLTELRLALGRPLPISHSGDGERIIFQLYKDFKIKQGFYQTPAVWVEADRVLSPRRGSDLTHEERIANLTFANRVAETLLKAKYAFYKEDWMRNRVVFQGRI